MPKFNGLKQRILPILLRRPSDISTKTTSAQNNPQIAAEPFESKVPIASRLSKPTIASNTAYKEEPIPVVPLPSPLNQEPLPTTITTSLAGKPSSETPPTPPVSSHSQEQEETEKSTLLLERPTPEDFAFIAKESRTHGHPETVIPAEVPEDGRDLDGIKNPSSVTGRKTISVEEDDYFGPTAIMPSPATAPMLHKRVWVKRQGASATLVTLNDDDLVDDVREKILRKYGNSLGKSFDSPDITIRIIPRADSHGHHERPLGPEESVVSTLNQYYPAGQTIDEALIIDIPHRKTPRHSPRVYMDHHRPSENGGDYFSVMPVALNHSPHLNSTAALPTMAQQPLHAISVLNTGQLPAMPLPSPGATTRRHGAHRPKYGRTTTSSPTVLTTNVSHAGSHSDRVPGTPGIAPLPTPPISTVAPPTSTTPPLRASSPKPSRVVKPKKPKKTASGASPATSLLDGGVPPISVLIVEDNMINLRLLEAFMKRLKVRWQTAMNGRDAVLKWRTGGFHLVLMDIQLPIMSGLEATREIRRLERVNGIGVLSAKVGDGARSDSESAKPEGNDQLQNMDQFKSPVIVVALTASSLQSDRHEALAAGCNDFLTKPVNFVWLERKVMEWGCMQALIDFDGWRRWKDFAQNTPPTTKPVKGVAAASTASTALKSRRLAQDTHTDSSGDTDTPPPAKPAIPDTLVALNKEVESGDTIESIDSINSNDSIDTIGLSAPQKSPTAPTLTIFSTSSTSSIATAVPTRGTISRQSSAQSTRSAPSGTYPHSPIRAAAPSGSPVSSSYEEGRRRKRSSLSKSGLSGVREELEGVGAS